MPTHRFEPMDEHYIQIGDQTFLRSWARARVFRADEKDALPLSIQRATAEVEKKFHWQDGTKPQGRLRQQSDLLPWKFDLAASLSGPPKSSWSSPFSLPWEVSRSLMS